ncbi:MAG: FAD-binding protein [Dehalococcoidales bacterium]|nr:FAD-binding protein [Dehalococcoidales bacterium]
MEVERKECDLLVVGAGIAGLMAAIRARQLGASVIVAEKGYATHSGAGRAGDDHISCFIPEIHGSNLDDYVDEQMARPGAYRNAHLSRAVLRNYYERSHEFIDLWDSWGIPMKYEGKYYCAGHGVFGGNGIPGRPLHHLHYQGQVQKTILVEKTIESGADLMNRCMVFELLGNANGVSGALAIDTRQNKMYEFQAKTVLMCTGWAMRIFPSQTPGVMYNYEHPATCCGDGKALVYRLGGEVTAMEHLVKWCGIKNFSRCGKGTWVGVYRDAQGVPVGRFVTKPERQYGDGIGDVTWTFLDDLRKNGRGPVYLDGRGMSDEDLEDMFFWLVHEGNTATIDHLKKEGVDPRRNAIEFGTFGIEPWGKIAINDNLESSVKGVYACGDETSLGVGWAAGNGWMSAENAVKYAQSIPMPSIDKNKSRIKELRNLIEDMQNREFGITWEDANQALQNTLSEYCGFVRYDGMLQAGMAHLRRLKKKAIEEMKAKNQWELSRVLEVRNMYDFGELIFMASIERKETREVYLRPEYPVLDVRLNHRALFIKQVNDKPVFTWREVNHKRAQGGK